jgi:hypothetical protein
VRDQYYLSAGKATLIVQGKDLGAMHARERNGDSPQRRQSEVETKVLSPTKPTAEESNGGE